MENIWLLGVGVVTGGIAGMAMKGSGFALILDLMLGVAGAFLAGNIIGPNLGLGYGGSFDFNVALGAVGAFVLVFLFRVITRRV